MTFYSVEEVHIAYNEKRVELNAMIKIRAKDFNEEGELVYQIIDHNVGRVFSTRWFPKMQVTFNEVLTKKTCEKLLVRILKVTSVLKPLRSWIKSRAWDMDLPFKGGLSFSLGDIIIPQEKMK